MYIHVYEDYWLQVHNLNDEEGVFVIIIVGGTVAAWLVRPSPDPV